MTKTEITYLAEAFIRIKTLSGKLDAINELISMGIISQTDFTLLLDEINRLEELERTPLGQALKE